MFQKYLTIGILALAATLPGCGGCQRNPNPPQTAEERKAEEERKRKEEEKRKPDFEIGKFQTQPNDLSRVETVFKPGHWTSATVEAWTNNYDYSGELKTEPFALDRMPYRLGTSRPAMLPKSQKKFLEVVFYVPPGRSGEQLVTRLTPKNSNRELLSASHAVTRMREWQFHFPILSPEPEKYAFLSRGSRLDSLRPLDGGFETPRPYYLTAAPKIATRAPLPGTSLTWTSTAYVLWDGIEPSVLTLEQQQALVDWLHWGGQLIVSGPDSLDRLQMEGGFLAPFLPARAVQDIELAQEDLQHFSDEWTSGGEPLRVLRPWSGKKLEPADDPTVQVLAATAAEGGEPLVVERLVGRGRVVVTAFRLAQRELTANWRSFDHFLNGCLLRRPGRKFLRGLDDGIEGDIRIDWVGGHGRFDPRLVSRYRIFARDAQLAPEAVLGEAFLPGGNADLPPDEPPDFLSTFRSESEFDETPAAIGGGVAGWNSFNDVSELGRATLREAAGIRIPDSRFVAYLLGIYLLVLGPVNWSFFRLLGRVEWAWAAAPVITLASAGAVVYLAQLDIGFARSRTELAIVELHGNHPRAHITRYTALYSSLSTDYGLQFAEPDAVVQPFPLFSASDPVGREIVRGQGFTTVNYRRDSDDVTLAGFDVPSNSTGMLHSEQMLGLDGGLELRRRRNGGWEVHNRTPLNVRDAVVLSPEGTAWIGDLPPDESRRLDFRPAGEVDYWQQHRDLAPATSRAKDPDRINVRLLLKLIESQRTMEAGEWRLAGWIDGEIPGLEIHPRASQSRQAGVLVAHLRYAPLPPLQKDRNSRAELEKQDKAPPPTESTNAEKEG